MWLPMRPYYKCSEITMTRFVVRMRNRTFTTLLLACLASTVLSGCTAIAIVDATASTAVGVTKAAVGVTKIAVKGTAAVAGAVVPDKKDEKKAGK